MLAWTFSTGVLRRHEAAPLIVTPYPNLLHALDLTKPGAPRKWTYDPNPLRRAWRAADVVNRGAARPFPAWSVHAAALWIWHAPRLFEATLSSGMVHALQHTGFLLSALLFWWALIRAHGNHGAGEVYVFTTAVHTSILGALLTIAPPVWYPSYKATAAAWVLPPLDDQQLGGLIMWVPAGLVFAAWLKHSEKRTLLTGLTLLALCGCKRRPTVEQVAAAHGLAGPPLGGNPSRV